VKGTTVTQNSYSFIKFLSYVRFLLLPGVKISVGPFLQYVLLSRVYFLLMDMMQ
jgi:hypothetical protein